MLYTKITHNSSIIPKGKVTSAPSGWWSSFPPGLVLSNRPAFDLPLGSAVDHALCGHWKLPGATLKGSILGRRHWKFTGICFGMKELNLPNSLTTSGFLKKTDWIKSFPVLIDIFLVYNPNFPSFLPVKTQGSTFPPFSHIYIHTTHLEAASLSPEQLPGPQHLLVGAGFNVSPADATALLQSGVVPVQEAWTYGVGKRKGEILIAWKFAYFWLSENVSDVGLSFKTDFFNSEKNTSRTPRHIQKCMQCWFGGFRLPCFWCMVHFPGWRSCFEWRDGNVWILAEPFVLSTEPRNTWRHDSIVRKRS